MTTVHAMTFDTLQYAKKLKSVGFTEEQAEVQAEAVADLIEEKLVTKQDLKELERLMKHDIKELERLMKRDIKELELRMTIKLGAMLVAVVSILSIVIKF